MIPPGNSVEKVCKTPDLSLQGASRLSLSAFRGGRNVTVASSMPSLSSLSNTCIIVVDKGNDRQQQCHPAKEHAVELAKAIHQDDSKGKREKKERGGGGIGAGNNNDTPGFGIG